MINPQELGTLQLEHDKTEYLARLPEVDRQNVERIIDLFPQVMHEQVRGGLLLAVGGTINKPLPRKDIDLVIAMRENPDDPKKDDYSDYYQYFLQKFRTFQRIIEAISIKDPRLQIIAVLDPAVDEEFQNPAILKFDGSVKMTNKERGGTLLEFLRIDLEQFPSTRGVQKDKSFVVLAEVR